MVRAGSVVGAGAASPGEVVISDGTIIAVRPLSGPGDVDPSSVLVPGFVDLQVNGIGTVDVARADGASDWDRLDDALLSQGVTTWCPTVTSAPRAELVDAVRRVGRATSRSGRPRPTVAGVHLEGPYLAVPGAHPPEHLEGRVDTRWLAELAPELAVVTLAPELPGALDAIETLSAAGVVVSLGHSACRIEQAVAAADAGACMVTHLGNANGPLHQREPGLIGAALTDSRLVVGLIADLVHVHPGFISLALAAKGASRVALVTDAVAADAGHVGPVALDVAGRADGRSLTGDAARLPDGTLAGSVLTMERGVANVVAEAGATLAAAVTSASTTPARLLGLDDRGAIAPGRRADLVELSVATSVPPGSQTVGAKLEVRRVWIAGRPAWPPG